MTVWFNNAGRRPKLPTGEREPQQEGILDCQLPTTVNRLLINHQQAPYSYRILQVHHNLNIRMISITDAQWL